MCGFGVPRIIYLHIPQAVFLFAFCLFLCLFFFWGKKEKLNSFRQKGHNPTIKKVAMLRLAHEADQKLIGKIYKKAELLG